MPVHDIHWSQYPRVAEDPTARAWLTMQAGRNLAKHTVETYGRSMEDFLRFTAREEVRLDQAFIEGKGGLLRLKQEIPLTEAEVAAVDDGVTAFDRLLTQLADVPTPAGPTRRQIEEGAASEPTQVRRA